MKLKKNNIIFFIILAIMIVLTIVLIINIPKSKVVENIIESNVTDYYLCEGTYCSKRKMEVEDKKTNSICENCGREIINETTDIDKLCEKCSKATKRCKHCAEQISKEKLAENNRKKLQMAKYNIINVAENKIALLKNTDQIVLLTKDYSNKESNNSVLVFYNMIESKEIERVDLKGNYFLNGPEVTFDILAELEKGMKLEEAKKKYKEEEKIKEDYEALGRLFNLDEKIILITPDENKNFIYNLKTKELQENLKSQKGIYGDEEYYFIVDTKDNKTYYYFEKFDLYTDDIEKIDFEKYVFDNSEFKTDNLIEPSIKVLDDKKEYIVSYYDEEYGKVKLKLFDENKNEIELKNKEDIFFDTKTRIVKFDTKKNEEIWSYDKTLNDKIYREYTGM